MDFADFCGTCFGLFHSIHPRQGLLLPTALSMEFFRSGANRIIFPNQPYPDGEKRGSFPFPELFARSLAQQHPRFLPAQLCLPGEEDCYLFVHLSLCRQDCLPAHIVMVMPAWRGQSEPSLFREYVFLSLYTPAFAVPAKPVSHARRGGTRIVRLPLCRQDCLPAHIPMVTPARRGQSEPSLFREYVFLSLYTPAFAVPAKPVSRARREG